MMRFVLLGCPGVGKGTQASLLAKKLNIPKISTGDILRSAIEQKNPLGEKAKVYIHEGKLVPDDIVIEIIKERLKGKDCQRGFILDGFPRTTVQAEALTHITSVDIVFYLRVEKNELIKRLEGRRTCVQCAQMYHMEFNPPKKEGKCDDCGGKLIQRKDDERKTILHRFEQYDILTKPLLKHYQDQKLITEIDGLGGVSQIFQRILEFIKNDYL